MAKGITFSGAVTFNAPMIDIHDNEHVHVHTTVAPGKSDDEAEETEKELKPEEQQASEDDPEPELKAEEEVEALNLFAPQKSIAVFLCEPWFDDFSTDTNRFTKKWRNQLMTDLLNSSYGEMIAREWMVKGVRSRRTYLKAHVAGALMNAGVLKGSYAKIAKAVCQYVDVDENSLATYLGQGKTQRYAEWIYEYVNGQQDD